MTLRLALLALALLAGCRHRARRHRARPSAPAASNALLVAPPDGPAISLGRNRFIAGGLRVEGSLRAASPYPLTPLVACAETPEGWRFTAQDGTLYAAASFTGRLRVVGVLPAAQPSATPAGFGADARDGDAALDPLLPAHDRAPLPLPVEPERAAGRTDGMIDVLRGDEILRYDPASARVLRRVEAPGSACVLHRARAGTRAECTHEGWARAVFAEERGWAVIRDELHAEPMGALAFDDATTAWAVGAPCTQRATPDGSAACVYRADGTRVDVALPFDGSPVAMHGGVALFVEMLREASVTDAALWRDGALVAVRLPVSPAAARAARWDGDALTMVEDLALVRARIDRAGRVTVTRVAAPLGARAIVRGDGVTFAVGRAGAWRLVGGRFVALRAPVEGSAAGRDLGAGEGWCAGAWCRLSDALWWSAVGARTSSALSHEGAHAIAPSAPQERL